VKSKLEIDIVDIAGLTTRVVTPSGGDIARTVVLLHGFGAPGDDLVALAQFMDVSARFVFPEAPLELGGLYGDSRAWWLLDLAKLEADLRSGATRDRRSEVPEGLGAAREQLSRFLDQLKARYAIADSQLVLGGFSQGAMLSLDVALHRETPPAALILMSGTLIAETEWEPRLVKLAGVPILQSHGRTDQLLPFSIAEMLRDKLRGAGATVDFVQFVGGHEIPPIVLERATALVRGSV
jgi:phospholipase/carboxylesterase